MEHTGDGVKENEARCCPMEWDTWQWDIHATLLFVVRDGEILLIRKKRGIGAGKVNGPGGKIDPGETPQECAIRETQEELCVTPLGVRKVGELCFAMSDIPDIYCHVFRADDIEGTPEETEEAIPLWTNVSEVPYEQMWADDSFWLPDLIEGKSFRGRFVFEGETIVWSDVNFDVVY
jgi:8-oxo-dGTP diphosphatase